MKLLLTSSGLSKRAIAASLESLVGKLPSDTKVGLIPTAANVEPGNKDWVIHMYLQLWRFGYKWIDIIDPTAADVDWRSRLTDVDVVFVGGGNTYYLLDQCRKTGFGDWLRSHIDTKVYVGGSAGSIIATPNIDLAGIYGDPNDIGIEDTSGFAWIDQELMVHCTKDTFGSMKDYASRSSHDLYAIDDLSALEVVDGEVRVISEGMWEFYKAGAA